VSHALNDLARKREEEEGQKHYTFPKKTKNQDSEPKKCEKQIAITKKILLNLIRNFFFRFPCLGCASACIAMGGGGHLTWFARLHVCHSPRCIKILPATF
jgi:hypothetical protein